MTGSPTLLLDGADPFTRDGIVRKRQRRLTDVCFNANPGHSPQWTTGTR